MNTKNITLSSSDKVALVSNMFTMLSAGIPILETIDSLTQDAKGNQKKVLVVLRDDLTQGQHVYYSFARFPKVFDRVTVNIIKASEEAGTLDVALKDLRENIRKDSEFNDKIKSAFIYPVFIVGVFFAVMLLILIVVIPKISTVFSQLKVELPLPTKIMIFLSNMLLQQTLLVIVGAAAVGVGLFYLFKTNKKAFVNLLISLPLISTLAELVDLTRFSRSLYLLLSAGIPITSALELTQEVVVKRSMQSAIIHAKNVVLEGKKLSFGLRDSKKTIPSIIIKMIEAGERSGSLDKSMQDVSDYLDYQVSNKLKTVTALIEPILLVVVGILVGGMMMAIIAPMYSIIGQVSGGAQ